MLSKGKITIIGNRNSILVTLGASQNHRPTFLTDITMKGHDNHLILGCKSKLPLLLPIAGVAPGEAGHGPGGGPAGPGGPDGPRPDFGGPGGPDDNAPGVPDGGPDGGPDGRLGAVPIPIGGGCAMYPTGAVSICGGHPDDRDLGGVGGGHDDSGAPSDLDPQSPDGSSNATTLTWSGSSDSGFDSPILRYMSEDTSSTPVDDSDSKQSPKRRKTGNME